jgi:hypothetical protein
MLQELFLLPLSCSGKPFQRPGRNSVMDKKEYTIRDADRALLRIFSYLQDQREMNGALPQEAEGVFKILEGFLTHREAEIEPEKVQIEGNKDALSGFEFNIPSVDMDPNRLFDPKE